MNASAKRIAYLSVFAALGAVLVFLADILPTGRLALLALASLPVCAALMLFGIPWSAGLCAVTGLLGFLLFPGTASVGYGAFFGWYPIVKSLCERLKSRPIGWLLKYAAYSLAFLLYRLFAQALFTGAALPWYGLYFLGAAVFFVYDRAYSWLIRFYIEKLARHIT